MALLLSREIHGEWLQKPVGNMSVLAEVQAHDAYFCSMLELIPAEMYFHKEETDERSWNKYMKAPSKTEKRKVKGALLRKKFDLEQRKTNAQRQVENAQNIPSKNVANRLKAMMMKPRWMIGGGVGR